MKKQTKITYGTIAIISSIAIFALFFCFKGTKDYKAVLKQHEAQVWQALENVGIDRAQFDKAFKKHKNRPFPTDIKRTASGPVCDIVKTVTADFGINPATISIVQTNDQSAAAATHGVVHINEKKFNALSSNAQEFVVAHELQHMINRDGAAKDIIGTMLKEKNIQERTCDARNQFYRFAEERADIDAALAKPKYAQGYVEFIQALIEQEGENPGITHPKNSARLALAKDINSSTRGMA
jgi:hypothetical protein